MVTRWSRDAWSRDAWSRGALLLPVRFFRAVFLRWTVAYDVKVCAKAIKHLLRSSHRAQRVRHRIIYAYHRPIYYAMTEALVLTVSSGGSD